MYRRLLAGLFAGIAISAAPVAGAVVHIDFVFVIGPDPN